VYRYRTLSSLPSLTVSPDGKTIVHTGIASAAGAELVLVDNFR
jgi:hypothetical protein